MALTFREKIMQTVVTRLNAIATPSYSRDIKSVERAISEVPDVPPVPCIYVFEGEEQKDQDHAFGKMRCTFQVVIVYIITATRDQRSIANAMLGDITKAMGTEVTLNDDLGFQHVAELIELGNEVQTDNTRSPLLIVAVDYMARYSHKTGDQTLV